MKSITTANITNLNRNIYREDQKGSLFDLGYSHTAANQTINFFLYCQKDKSRHKQAWILLTTFSRIRLHFSSVVFCESYRVIFRLRRPFTRA